MKIGGMGYVPKHIKWIVECIGENISQTQENFIEIWDDGDEITFTVSPTGMKFEFELFIKKRFVLISGILSGKEIFHTCEKQYHLTKKGLEKGLRETIEQMKLEVTKYLDSILKAKKTNKL
jgi:hypothetical protein